MRFSGEHESDVERETHLPPSLAFRAPRSPRARLVLQASTQATNDTKPRDDQENLSTRQQQQRQQNTMEMQINVHHKALL